MTATSLEAVQQTLAEYERLAIGTGEWNGTDAPEFSNDGETWSAAWLPTDDNPHPVLARATVYRKGVERPVVVIVRWDEALPAIDDWRDLWLRKPIALFGAFTVRVSLRRAFRDVIGDRHEPDETVDVDAPTSAVVERDWLAELAKLETEDAVQQLHKEAKAARAVTVDMERALRLRLLAIQGPGRGARLVDTAVEASTALVAALTSAASTPKPAPPKVRLEDTVRRPKTARRPQKPKPRGPHA